MFKIKSYVKQRLGKLYFPDVEPETARRNLLLQIAKRPALESALHVLQSNRKAKKFSEAEVSMIVACLGQPPFKDSSELRDYSLAYIIHSTQKKENVFLA